MEMQILSPRAFSQRKCCVQEKRGDVIERSEIAEAAADLGLIWNTHNKLILFIVIMYMS